MRRSRIHRPDQCAQRRHDSPGQAFYAQVEGQPIATAYVVTSEAMACNMLLDDASEGIDAFLGKRAPAWQGR